MNTLNQKLFKLFNVFALLASLCCAPLSAAIESEVPKSAVDHYLKEFPWIGLIADEINYGPIEISHIHIQGGSKLAIVEPGATLHGSVKYKINPKHLAALHRYHLVIGIKGLGAQDCVTHNYGVWKTSGHGKFTLKAPLEPGVYEVRFLLTDDLTCDGARDEWNTGKETPSSAATIGVIIVR